MEKNCSTKTPLFPKLKFWLARCSEAHFPDRYCQGEKYTISYLKDKTLRYPEHVALITAG